MKIQQLTGSAGMPPAPRMAGSVSPSAPTLPPGPEQVQQAVEQIQRAVSIVAQNLLFTVD